MKVFLSSLVLMAILPTLSLAEVKYQIVCAEDNMEYHAGIEITPHDYSGGGWSVKKGESAEELLTKKIAELQKDSAQQITVSSPVGFVSDATKNTKKICVTVRIEEK